MTIATSILGFFLTIIILVTIHEFGHYWVAKKLNVKILQFSVGMGKVLKSWQKGETIFTLSAFTYRWFCQNVRRKRRRS